MLHKNIEKAIMLLLLLICNGIAIDYEISSKIILDFLKFKNSKISTIFICWDLQLVLKISKLIMSKEIRVKIVNNFNINTSLLLLNSENFYYQAVVLDAECPDAINILHRFSEEKKFNTTYHWFILDEYPNKLIPTLSKLNLNIDTEITLATPQTGSTVTYDLFDVYNPGYENKGKLNVTKIGSWNKQLGYKLNINLQQTKFERRANMSDVELKSIIVITNKLHQPYMDYLVSHENTDIDSMNRFNYALMRHVRDIYNFKYIMYRTNSWGYLINNTFDGMVGALQRKIVDIGASPAYFRKARFEVTDYTIETWKMKPCFIFRQPNTTAIYNAFLKPFNTPVWLSAVGSCVIITLAIRFALVAEHVIARLTAIRHGVPEMTWSNAALIVVGAICQQGPYKNPVLTSGRIIILQMFLFAIIFYQFYSASIVSSLLMSPPRPIKNLDDLIDSSIKIGIEDIVYNRDFFKTTTEPRALKMHSKKVAPAKYNPYMKPLQGLQKVQRGEFAFLVDYATAYKYITETFNEKEICDLDELYLYPPERLVAMVQKGSPFRKTLAYGMRKVEESGLMDREFSIWIYAKPKCVHQMKPADIIVGLREVSSAFFLLFAGMIISAGILVTEILFNNRKKNVNRR